MSEKPKCELIGSDGNVFAIVGSVSKCLKMAGQPDKAKEMADKVFDSKSYQEALTIVREYVDVE